MGTFLISIADIFMIIAVLMALIELYIFKKSEETIDKISSISGIIFFAIWVYKVEEIIKCQQDEKLIMVNLIFIFYFIIKFVLRLIINKKVEEKQKDNKNKYINIIFIIYSIVTSIVFILDLYGGII
jgi:putative copper export protein